MMLQILIIYNTRNVLLIDCIIVYSQKNKQLRLIDEKQP